MNSNLEKQNRNYYTNEKEKIFVFSIVQNMKKRTIYKLINLKNINVCNEISTLLYQSRKRRWKFYLK